jgi:hypothetical protein
MLGHGHHRVALTEPPTPSALAPPQHSGTSLATSCHAPAGPPARRTLGDETRHARVVTIQRQPGKCDEAIRLFQEAVVPVAQRPQGFRRIELVTDREPLAKFGGIWAAPPVREVYEVSVQV